MPRRPEMRWRRDIGIRQRSRLSVSITNCSLPAKRLAMALTRRWPESSRFPTRRLKAFRLQMGRVEEGRGPFLGKNQTCRVVIIASRSTLTSSRESLSRQTITSRMESMPTTFASSTTGKWRM
jgi:hypothetical protein